MKILIIIPTYNESDTIKNIILKIIDINPAYNILIVDDNSPDGTADKVRELQSNDVRVYWDEQQKDGTYVRIWGVIKGVNETYATGGPRAIMSYDFNLMVEEIALLDIDGDLMTDIFPIGGIQDARSYT